MRCSSCNKFVPFDEPEVEIQDEEVDFDADAKSGTVRGNVRIALKCAECGDELKEATLDWEQEFEHDCPKLKEVKEGEEAPEPSFDTNLDAEGTDRFETTNSKGKPISPRYQKHFYGATISGEVTCSECGASIPVEATVEEQASAFDEL